MPQIHTNRGNDLPASVFQDLGPFHVAMITVTILSLCSSRLECRIGTKCLSNLQPSSAEEFLHICYVTSLDPGNQDLAIIASFHHGVTNNCPTGTRNYRCLWFQLYSHIQAIILRENVWKRSKMLRMYVEYLLKFSVGRGKYLTINPL